MARVRAMGPPRCCLCFHPVGEGAPGRTLAVEVDDCTVIHNDLATCTQLISIHGSKGMRRCASCYALADSWYTNYRDQILCWPCADGQPAEAPPESDEKGCDAPAGAPQTTVYGIDVSEWDRRWRESDEQLRAISSAVLRLLAREA